uniref:Uncharacterized protein n=1 Tax=Caenorhabditis tropicalis TaxID=1561998 RepID=A0A1I7TUG8_9PELO
MVEMNKLMKVLLEGSDSDVELTCFRMVCETIHLRKEDIDELEKNPEVVKIVTGVIPNILFGAFGTSTNQEEMSEALWQAIWDKCKGRIDNAADELTSRMRRTTSDIYKGQFAENPEFEKVYREKEAAWKIESWFTEACYQTEISKERYEMMKTNPKLMKMIADCARETALKHGFSEVHNSQGKRDPKLKNAEFKRAVFSAVMEHVLNSLEPLEVEFRDHFIESMKERIASSDDCEAKRVDMRELKTFEDFLAHKDPYIIHNGQKMRASELDQKKFAVIENPAGGFKVIDRKDFEKMKKTVDPKSLEEAEGEEEEETSFFASILERLRIW